MAISVSALVIVIILVASNKGEGEGTVAEQKSPQQTDQSPHDKKNGGEADGSTIGTDTTKNAGDGSIDGQYNGVAGQNDGTKNNGETSNPVKTIDEPPTKTDTTTPETPGTNDTSTQPVEPPKPIVADTPKKQPLPTDEQQKPVLATLEETFKLSEKRSSEDQLKLAAELLKLAGESKDSVETFVLLRGAMSYASEGGDAQLVMTAVNAIDRHFEMERFDIGQKALIGFCGQASTKEAFGSLADAADKFVEEALAADRVDVAKSLAEVVYNTMVKKSVAAEFRKAAYEQRKRIDDIYSEWKLAHDALETLKANPEDPNANTLVGKWYCFGKNDWKSGLQYLAKSNDDQLKTLALREIGASVTTVEDRLALGDARWDAAENSASGNKRALQRRAAIWYMRARPDTTSSLDKKRIEVRLAKVGDLPSESAVASDSQSGSSPSDDGKDLLARANSRRAFVVGNWDYKDKVLVSPFTPYARIQFDYELPDEYELTLVAERLATTPNIDLRQAGRAGLVLGLSHGQSQFLVVFDYNRHGDGLCTALGAMNGEITHRANPARHVPKMGLFGSGKTTKVVLTVLNTGVRLEADGREIFDWKGQFTELQLLPPWSGPKRNNLLIGTHLASYRVSELSVRPIEDGKSTSTKPEKPANLTEASSGLPNGEPITLIGHSALVMWVAFSPDSKILASSGYDGAIKLWDLSTNRELRSVLATAAHRSPVDLWDLATGRKRGSLSGHEQLVHCAAFAPGGRILASGGSLGKVILWDLVTGQPLANLAAHTGQVWGVAFSPDGKYLASAGEDKTVRLWALKAGR